MDTASVVARIRDESRNLENRRYIFRLAAVEEQFYLLHPRDNFGACWHLVDRRVREYPGIFSAGESEQRLEGLEVERNENSDFVLPEIQDVAARRKIVRCLESLAGRMALEGNKHVVRQPYKSRNS